MARSGDFRAPADGMFQPLHPCMAAVAEEGPLRQESFMVAAGRDGCAGRCQGVAELLTGDADHLRTTGPQLAGCDLLPAVGGAADHDAHAIQMY